MKKIWLTRPEDDSSAFAEMLGMPCIIAPVMRIQARTVANFGAKPEGIILTSRHALPGNLRDDWRNLPIYCVGKATAAVARSAGFSDIIEGGGDAMLLAARIAYIVKSGAQLLYLSGEETRIDLPSLLAARDIAVRSLVTYDAIAETSLAPELIRAIQKDDISGVVFFSPRSATLAAELLGKENLTACTEHIHAFCLSVAVAEAAGVLPWRSLKVAATPTNTAMLQLLAGNQPDESV